MHGRALTIVAVETRLVGPLGQSSAMTYWGTYCSWPTLVTVTLPGVGYEKVEVGCRAVGGATGLCGRSGRVSYTLKLFGVFRSSAKQSGPRKDSQRTTAPIAYDATFTRARVA